MADEKITDQETPAADKAELSSSSARTDMRTCETSRLIPEGCKDAVDSGAGKKLSGNRPKVLLAEDNPVIRKSLHNFLDKWGYEGIEAETGDDAVKILDEHPDLRLSILDWNLPGLSGMQVCQRIRSRPAGKYIYIIMFSARKSIEEQIMALDGGADDYLVKPSKPAVLRARLDVGRRIIELALSGKN